MLPEHEGTMSWVGLVYRLFNNVNIDTLIFLKSLQTYESLVKSISAPLFDVARKQAYEPL
jgi:hypothetical protein